MLIYIVKRDKIRVLANLLPRSNGGAMDWQPGAAYGAGEEPGRGPALPDSGLGGGPAEGSAGLPGSDHDAPRSPSPCADRDRRLAGFARDGEWDRCPPSAALAAAV